MKKIIPHVAKNSTCQIHTKEVISFNKRVFMEASKISICSLMSCNMFGIFQTARFL